ncbi:MAG: hypothetical protein QW478_00060 [Candidatus Micrarchaeaceae archaeon]
MEKPSLTKLEKLKPEEIIYMCVKNKEWEKLCLSPNAKKRLDIEKFKNLFEEELDRINPSYDILTFLYSLTNINLLPLLEKLLRNREPNLKSILFILETKILENKNNTILKDYISRRILKRDLTTRLSIITLLLSYGANPNVFDKIVEQEYYAENEYLIELLLSFNANPNVLVTKQNIPLLEYYINKYIEETDNITRSKYGNIIILLKEYYANTNFPHSKINEWINKCKQLDIPERCNDISELLPNLNMPHLKEPKIKLNVSPLFEDELGISTMIFDNIKDLQTNIRAIISPKIKENLYIKNDNLILGHKNPKLIGTISYIY